MLTVNATNTVQFTLGFMPAVLLILRVANVGVLLEFNTGDTVPLKLMTPFELEVMAFSNRIVCRLVPLKVVVPVLVKIPLLVRSPLSTAVPLPPA